MSKRQSLSPTTVLFRTTFTQTIKLNLLLVPLFSSVVVITRQFGNRREIEKLRVRVLALRQSFVKGGGGGG